MSSNADTNERISEAEHAVMEVLWEKEDRCIRSVEDFV